MQMLKKSMAMKELPMDQWRVVFRSDCIAIAAHADSSGKVVWSLFALSDFPKVDFPREDGFRLQELYKIFVGLIIHG